MKDNKKILQYCPNFYKIISFESEDGDTITDKIISIYREYIFRIDPNNNEDLLRVKEIDQVIYKYIEDYSFRRELKSEIVKVKISREEKDILKKFIEYIIRIFNNYEEYTTRTIYVSRWI